MLKFLKMTVAEDVTTMEEIQVVLEEEILKDVKVILRQEEKVDLEAREHQEAKDLLKEHQDVLKASAIHPDQEGQKEINTYC